MIINLFCDASIELEKKIACGGTYIMAQMDDCSIQEIGFRRALQLHATNNSSEILAIWLGVVEALKLRNIYPNAVFRLFSDSKISLYGLRDWMKYWIANMKEDGILISSSGKPVMNQQRFIDIYNIIVENNLHIELYHQRGHVGESGKTSLDQARVQFIRANKVTPEALGLSIEFISQCNSKVDNLTRQAVRSYVFHHSILPNTEVERVVPMDMAIKDNMLHQYIRCINKSSLEGLTRHDFKGGYNQ